jgi:hypothetical protein
MIAVHPRGHDTKGAGNHEKKKAGQRPAFPGDAPGYRTLSRSSTIRGVRKTSSSVLSSVR